MKIINETTNYRRLRLTLCATLAIAAAVPSIHHLIGTADATAASRALVKPHLDDRAVIAPGRITPLNGIVTLAAAASPLGPAVVSKLLVEEGDLVRPDQTLAVLSGHDACAAQLASSERRVDVARAKLDALKAGSKREDLRALEAEVRAQEATVAQLAAETSRTRQLHAEHVVSGATLEAQQARYSVAAMQLEATRARLEGLSSARPADIAVAMAELAAAQAEAASARAKLSEQSVRAPAEGRVLRIHARAGQAIGPQGLLDFAQSGDMFVDAEVMEHDVARTRVGRSVRVTGDGLESPLRGTVERVGMMVGPREVLAIDPTAFSDARIVHVLIRLEESSIAERLINARVTAEISR